MERSIEVQSREEVAEKAMDILKLEDVTVVYKGLSERLFVDSLAAGLKKSTPCIKTKSDGVYLWVLP